MNRKIRTWVEISLNDLEHNYREISSRLPDGCQMLGVCKANAYGHGAVRVAQRLQRAGCQWIAVNCYDEAEELRAAGVTMNILLLGPQSANIAVDLATLGVTQAVGSIEYARELNRFLAGTGLRLNAHMKLETGMGRTGFDVHDDSHLDEMLEALSLPHLNFTGVFTHFAVSDENGDPYTQLQFSRFLHAIDCMEQASGPEICNQALRKQRRCDKLSADAPRHGAPRSAALRCVSGGGDRRARPAPGDVAL